MTEGKVTFQIGGRWAVSWLIILWAFPALLLLVPLTESGVDSWWGFWRWTLLGFVSLIPFLLLYWVADRTLFKNREENPLPNYTVFLLGFVLGAVRESTVIGMAHTLNMVSPGDLPLAEYFAINVLHHGIVMMLTLPFLTIIAAACELYIGDRRALLTELMLHQSQKSESAAVIKSLRSSMTRKVDENLLKVVNEAKEYIERQDHSRIDNWEALAGKLRKAALDTIRPFSHRLHRDGEERSYSLPLLELLRFIASNLALEVPWVILGYLALTVRDILFQPNPAMELVNLALRVIVIFVGLKTIMWIRGRGYLRHPFSFYTTLIAFVVLFDFSVDILNTFLGQEGYSNQGRTAHGLALLLLILLVGFTSAFLRGQHAEVQFLKEQVGSEKLEAIFLKREEARLSRDLAKYLHGTIQSRLMASAMAIEKAGRSGNRSLLDAEIEKALETLKLPSQEYFASNLGTLREEVEKTVAKWKGLMTTRIKIESGLVINDEEKIKMIASTVNEALSNSFRHGSATKANVVIESFSTYLKVEVSDNGQGPKNGKPGLGSKWFDSVAGNKWSLKLGKNGKGALLKVQIPL